LHQREKLTKRDGIYFVVDADDAVVAVEDIDDLLDISIV
jgi:hypothetical protein